MPLDDQQKEIIRRHTRGLMEEARTYMTAPPKIWGISIDQWSKLNQPKNQSKIWLADQNAESFNADVFVFHQIPTTIGDFFAVQPYDNLRLGATEFLIVINKSIPTSFYTCISSGLKSVRWNSPQTANDAFLQKYINALNDNWDIDPPLNGELLTYANHWLQRIDNVSFFLPYTMQLAPLDQHRTLFLFMRTYDDAQKRPFSRTYHVGEFLLLSQNLSRFLSDFQLPANFIVKPKLHIPTWSILPFPKLAEDLPSQGQRFEIPLQPEEPFFHLFEGLSPKEGYQTYHQEELIQCTWCKQWSIPVGGKCPHCKHQMQNY